MITFVVKLDKIKLWYFLRRKKVFKAIFLDDKSFQNNYFQTGKIIVLKRKKNYRFGMKIIIFDENGS